jgi:two-component sensor histidine kinase
MVNATDKQQIVSLRHREEALAHFGTYAFAQIALQPILDEAARVCAECLNTAFSKICRYEEAENGLLVVAGHGWNADVVGFAISVADESTPQGRAFSTGAPQVCANISEVNTYTLPPFYPEHHVLSTVDVIIAAKTSPPFGVLEVDSQVADAFDEHDINFLTGFANILAEAVVAAGRAEDLRKTIARMRQLVEEKETLSNELKHRVRNSLHLVYGLLTAEMEGRPDAAAIVAFRSIALRVMGLAQVFDHLLGTGMSRVINFGEYLGALCESLPELYHMDGVRLSCSAESASIELDDATALGIVLTEIVNNAYIHAFPTHAGSIAVSLRVKAGDAVLTIADDGTGFVEVSTARHGMRLVRRLVQQVSGTITLGTGSGSVWTIVFPLKAVPVPVIA